MHEGHLRHHCLVVPQRMPAHREVDQWGVEKRYGHLAGGLDDFQPVYLIGTAPPGQVHIGYLAAVVTHVGQLVVEVVAHQVGQGQVQRHQQHDQAGQADQRPAIAGFHEAVSKAGCAVDRNVPG
ncbi:hypothetical protein D9M71_666980 [compost metagenome]